MNKSLIDIVWVIMASGLVFIMQAGFAMVEAGMTRSKNNINVAVKNLTDLGVSTAFFWLTGFALMFGSSASGLLGTDGFFYSMNGAWPATFFLFQVMFCSTSATIVSGAVAERMKYSSYIISTILLSAVIYPIFGHWVWGGLLSNTPSGWLETKGFVDFAGSTVVHSMGGWVSLALLIILKPRTGRFGPNGESNTINGSNIPIAVLGVILLWFGWFGFNGGSTLAASKGVPGIIINTTLAAAAGMIGALAIGWFHLKKPDVGLLMNGSLAGLVAITANCHAVGRAESLLIGLVGGIIMYLTTILLDKLKIDDAVGAIPVHLAAGIWGTLAVALFGDPAILKTGHSMGKQLLIQLEGIGACAVWGFGISFIFLFLLNKISPLRVSLQAEYEGLNKAEHGVTTEILDFYNVLQEQSQTGELSVRAPVEPFTEIGQIATIYNSVMDKLEQAHEEYISLLNNVSDGLFLIDRDHTIGEHYSMALETILESSAISGKRFSAILKPLVPEKAVRNVEDFLDLAFDIKKPFRTIEKLNPLSEGEFSFGGDTGSYKIKHLQLLFKRIESRGEVVHVMVLMRDVTKQKELAIEVEETRKRTNEEMELFYNILNVDPSILSQFLQGAQDDIAAINTTLATGTEITKEMFQAIFRHAHAVKGDADMIGLDVIAAKAQVLESGIQEVMENKHAENEDLLPIILLLTELKGAVEKIIDLLEKWEVRRSAVQPSPDDFIADSLKRLAGRVCERYGKEVLLDCQLTGVTELSRAMRKHIQDILVQFVRNSIYHGIEMPDQREKQGKARSGSIFIQGGMKDSFFTIFYKDDGAGFDADKIRAKAVKNKLITREAAAGMAEMDVYKLVFTPNFSTADKTDTTAGRGVGMDLVRHLVSQAGGRLSFRSKKGVSLEFSVSLPAGEAE